MLGKASMFIGLAAAVLASVLLIPDPGWPR